MVGGGKEPTQKVEEMEEMTSGDGREDGGGDETISSSSKLATMAYSNRAKDLIYAWNGLGSVG